MKKLIAIAVIALCGCDPVVMVRNDWANCIARTYIDEDKAGELVGFTKAETPSNYVITVTFTKKESK